MWLHRAKAKETTISLWLYRANHLVGVASRQQSRCGFIEPTPSLWLNGGCKFVKAALHLALDASSQSRLAASRDFGFISLWLHRTNPLVVAPSWQQARSCCIEATVSLWPLQANHLLMAALKHHVNNNSLCVCIRLATRHQ